MRSDYFAGQPKSQGLFWGKSLSKRYLGALTFLKYSHEEDRVWYENVAEAFLLRSLSPMEIEADPGS